MKRLSWLLVLVLAAVFNARAQELPPAVAELFMNGQQVLDLDWRTEGDKEWFLSFSSTSGPLLDLDVNGNSDPFLNYAAAFINPFEAPTTFTLNLFIPYTGGPYNTVRLSHSSSITDGGAVPDGNVTVTTNLQPTVSNGIVDMVRVIGLSAGCDVGGAPGFSDICFSGGPAIQVGIAPTPPVGTFGITLDFVLSANDLYTANGRIDLLQTVIPEPATYLLVGTGLIGIAFLRRRFTNN